MPPADEQQPVNEQQQPVRKRPLGLGAKGAAKLAKTEPEEQADAPPVFEVPEEDLSEEAEIKSIFSAAEAAYDEFKALSPEERLYDCSKPEEQQLALRASKLYSGVIHKCDRLLKLRDEGELSELSPAIFEIFGDALFKSRTLLVEELDDIEEDDEYLEAAMEKYDAGLDEFPGNVDLLYSKARCAIVQALLSGDFKIIKSEVESAAFELPALAEDGYQMNLKKIWQSLQALLFLVDDIDALASIARFCLKIVPKIYKLTVEESLQMISWQAKLVEALLGEEDADTSKVEGELQTLESWLQLDVPEDTETQTTLGELKSQFYLLKGSKCALDSDCNAERECYEHAYEIFKDMQTRFGIVIPDFMEELMSE